MARFIARVHDVMLGPDELSHQIAPPTVASLVWKRQLSTEGLAKKQEIPPPLTAVFSMNVQLRIDG